MTAKLEAIVFDLDGTLIDSAPELASALNSGLSDAGRGKLDVEEVKMMVGDGIDKLVERGLEATGGPLGAERFREVADRVREFPESFGPERPAARTTTAVFCFDINS